MRRESDNNENKMRRNEDLKGKGGGRLKHCDVDGDVPLCLRTFEQRQQQQQQKNSKERMVSSISNIMKDGSKSTSTSGSKELCGNTTEKKNQESQKATSNDTTFIVLQKNMRSTQ